MQDAPYHKNMPKFTFLFCLALVFSSPGYASGAPSTPGPSSQIEIAKVKCSDLTSATPLDRAAIVMFYWGYEAAKAGATTFKTGILQNATRALMAECNGNANEPVLDAMRRINVKAF
jgi:HdeA/HdeB family